MKKLALILILLMGLIVPWACTNNTPVGPLATYNLTATFTNTATSTPTNWAGYTSTSTPLYSPTATNTATNTATATITNTLIYTLTNTPTATATNTATSTITPASPTPVYNGITWNTSAPPNGLAYDGTNVYVAEGSQSYSNGQIQIFNASSGNSENSYTSVGSYTFGLPNGVAYSTGTDYIYVADQDNDALYVINPSGWTLVGGAPLVTWTVPGGSPVGAPNSFLGPQGVAADSFGNIYVADASNDYVEEFNPSLTPVAEYGGTGTFNNPDAIAIDGSNNIYVVDATSSSAGVDQRVQKFTTLTGSPSPTLSFTTTLDYPNSDIWGITINGGNIYLADSGSDQVEEYSSTGTSLTSGLGVSPSNSPSPDGLLFIGSNLLVADYSNSEIYQLTP